jgi:hypothetical protein
MKSMLASIFKLVIGAMLRLKKYVCKYMKNINSILSKATVCS